MADKQSNNIQEVKTTGEDKSGELGIVGTAFSLIAAIVVVAVLNFYVMQKINERNERKNLPERIVVEEKYKRD